jgi:hypothetical protein
VDVIFGPSFSYVEERLETKKRKIVECGRVSGSGENFHSLRQLYALQWLDRLANCVSSPYKLLLFNRWMTSHPNVGLVVTY